MKRGEAAGEGPPLRASAPDTRLRAHARESRSTGSPAASAGDTGDTEPILRHIVHTPENVEFEYALAGLASRFAAWLADSAFSAVFVLLGLVVVSLAQGSGLKEARVGLGGGMLAFVGLLIVFGAQWGYYVLCETLMGGQTPGKKIVGIRVIAADGVRLTFAQSATRNLLRMIDAFPVAAVIDGASPLLHLVPLFILPGAVCALLSRRSQRIGDIAAGTLVVDERRRPLPSAVVPLAERNLGFVADRRVAEALHHLLRPAEADALVTLCLRREELELKARLELFHEAATRLECRLGIERPPELSDEKLVLNLVAILLGSERTTPAAARLAKTR